MMLLGANMTRVEVWGVGGSGEKRRRIDSCWGLCGFWGCFFFNLEKKKNKIINDITSVDMMSVGSMSGFLIFGCDIWWCYKR